jgi:hypothetical protein
MTRRIPRSATRTTRAIEAGSGRGFIIAGSGGGGDTEVPPVISTTLAGLGAGSDGKVGLIRIGTYPDVHEEEFVYSSAAGRWIGTREYLTMKTADTWGMDLNNYALSAIANTWARFYNPLPYGSAASRLQQQFVAGTDTTMHIANNTSFTTSGQVRLRNQTITYTGKNLTTQLTGCSGGTGTFPADNNLAVQGQVGGWGTTSTPLDRVGALYAAGFKLQERANAWLNGGRDTTTMSVSAFYKEGDADENLGGALWPANASGLRAGVILISPSGPPSDVNRDQERGFLWRQSTWSDLGGATPTKRFLMPALYGRMNSATPLDNGEVYGYTLRHRWVSA